MALDSGRRLGQYEIIASIGVGGMGEVYRARDTKLGREVAIKVLREELSKDQERLSRFEREAKLLASLNHPAIATLYGFEDDFLVMKLVEGETLAERIARGPIPIDEALPLFIQIAEGVEAAHEKTVVHRDLKPANIKITPDGRPKILDFGLAKAFGGDEASPIDASQSPTLTKGTALGVIMGTAAYMSPEQARGKVVDKRTDVWAFGCCLYEALTGKSPFARDNVTDTLAAVVKEDPNFELLPMGTPAKVRGLLRRCLRRDARARQRDIGDVGLELSELDDEAPRASRATWTRKQLLTVVVSALGALVLGFSIHRTVGPATRDTSTVAGPVSRSIIDLPPEAPLGQKPLVGFDSPKLAISPDGAQLIYVGEFDGGTALFHREIASFEVSRIAGTEGAIHPFFSPDGRWVGFLTNDQVKKVSLRGDPPMTLSAVSTPVRASWHTSDIIYVTDDAGWGLTRVSAGDGSASQVAMLNAQFPGAYWVHITDVLPHGDAALVAVSSRSISADYADIYLIMLDSLETKLLIQFGYGARHLASGHLVFARGGSLLAVPFHQDRLEVAGEPVPVVNDVRMESLTGHVQFTVSGNGTLAYVPGEDEGVGKIAWVDRSGGVEFLSVPEQAYGAPNIAPDGQRVAVDVADVNDYIWIYDFERQEGRRLTTGKFPVWSPDGDAIAFSAVQPGGQWKMLVQPVDRVERPRELWTTGGMAAATTWSPDERTIGVYQEANTNSIGFLAAEGGRDVETVPKQSGVHLFPAFSPDGRYVAYTSTETGGFEIWVRSFPDGQTVKQVSVNGGTEVVWCENGELFFRAGNQWMVVAMTTEPELTWDPPRPLFKTDFIDTPALSFDVSPDGQRILLFKRTREAERKKLHLVVNWFEELKQLVPTDN